MSDETCEACKVGPTDCVSCGGPCDGPCEEHEEQRQFDEMHARHAASEAEVTRLREELDQAKLDIAEARELIASYDKDTRKLRGECDDYRQAWKRDLEKGRGFLADLDAARLQLEEARGLLARVIELRHAPGCICDDHERASAFLTPATAPTCATCGVTGGEGFLITNEDGTPCLDRPCPTCSPSVKR